MEKRPITEELHMARLVCTCRGRLSVFGVWSSAALGLHFSRVVCVFFLDGSKQTSGCAAVVTRGDMERAPPAHTRSIHSTEVSPGNSAMDCSGWRSQQMQRGRTVGVFSAQRRVLRIAMKHPSRLAADSCQ
jgi:hypothetical protein